jgi:hypothetical protein
LVVLAEIAYLVGAVVMPGSGSLQVVSSRSDVAGIHLDLRVQAAPGQTMTRLAAIPESITQADRSVDVVVDPSYPGPDSDPIAVQGVYDHLVGELRIRGDHRKVDQIDARQAERLLRDLDNARNTALVMTAGVMPAGVFSTQTDLLTPWIRAGGMLVWSGDALGYYSETPAPTFRIDRSDSLFEGGPLRVVGGGVVIPGKQPGRIALTPTAIGRALAVQSTQTSVSVDAQRVVSLGGELLGYVSDGFSSLSEIPVGKGKVLIFAGDTYDEQVIAHDLCMVLISHVDEEVSAVSALDLPKPSANVSWTVPSPPSGATLKVIAMDPSPDGVAFLEKTVSP